jgi:hypothetical protein
MGLSADTLAPPVLPKGTQPAMNPGTVAASRVIWPSISRLSCLFCGNTKHPGVNRYVRQQKLLAEDVGDLKVGESGAVISGSVTGLCSVEILRVSGAKLGVHCGSPSSLSAAFSRALQARKSTSRAER